MNHYNIKIFGKVQGINFRWSASRKANSLKLTGFVRNELDGSVYVEAEGDEEKLQKFINWCRKGPLFAKVDSIEFEQNTNKGYNIFEIKP